MPEEATPRIFRFHAFEVHETLGELRKRGVRVKLHSQPFQILLMLLERPAELITRDEMRQRLWGENTFVDFDHGLNAAINKVREALSDSAAKPRFIETVPGKGYRFIAPVTLERAVSADAANRSGTLPPSDGGSVVANASGSGALCSDCPSPISAEEAANPLDAVLAAPQELPPAPLRLVSVLLQVVQCTYLAFYVGALANLHEIRDIIDEAKLLAPDAIFGLLVTTAAALIPVRLFLFTAILFDIRQLREKFLKLFPVLLAVDLLWALSPFLLIHHINGGLALGMTAALVYLPFAQRSLFLMFTRRHPS